MVLWAAAPTSTVNELIAIVRTGLSSGQSDGSIARSLRRIKLSERLDTRVVEELESQGAGTRTVAQLSQMQEVSRTLAPPAAPLPFKELPAPSPEERHQVLAEARAVALDYGKSLPDFICIENVNRFVNTTGNWQPADQLELRLSYFGQREDYKLLSLNGRPMVRSYEEVGGATSQGEFGSLLRMIFELKSLGEFEWKHWTTLRKRPAYVFAFLVRRNHASFVLLYQAGRSGPRSSALVGQRGFVYIDRETKSIVRIISEADDIPKDFAVQSSFTLLDYEFTNVGTRQFLLPLRADVRMSAAGYLTRNQVEFHSYRKFSSEATITFEPH
jgi:hypothetical protein